MIWSVLKFELKPGKLPELRDTFQRHRVLETAIQVEGCRDLVLAAPDANGTTAYVMGLWDDSVAYQRWLDHPERGASSADLAKLLVSGEEPSAPAELWPVLHAAAGTHVSPPGAGVSSTGEEIK